MTPGIRYYVGRVLLSVAMGAAMLLLGGEWWVAALTAAATFALFIWIPQSGLFIIDNSESFTPLRRDERAQAIVNLAARNGFAVTIIALGAVALIFGARGISTVPVHALNLVLVLGTLTYLATELWQRRR
jgi:hypothetical protein